MKATTAGGSERLLWWSPGWIYRCLALYHAPPRRLQTLAHRCQTSLSHQCYWLPSARPHRPAKSGVLQEQPGFEPLASTCLTPPHKLGELYKLFRKELSERGSLGLQNSPFVFCPLPLKQSLMPHPLSSVKQSPVQPSQCTHSRPLTLLILESTGMYPCDGKTILTVVRTQLCQSWLKMFNSQVRRIVIVNIEICCLQIREELIPDQVPRSPLTANISRMTILDV